MTSKKRIEVVFFQTAAGVAPVREWLRRLSKEDRRTIGEDIKTVEFGWPIGMPVCRSLKKGLYEVRSTLGNRIARVLFVIEDGEWFSFMRSLRRAGQRRRRISMSRGDARNGRLKNDFEKKTATRTKVRRFPC